MPNRSRKRRLPDPAQVAHSIIQRIDGEAPPAPADDGKNPAAVALGRLGGLKGGPARAKALGKKKLRESAKKAAAARWKKQNQ